VSAFPITIKPYGKNAVLVEWPKTVDKAILEDILQFTERFKHLGLDGWEMSVAYNSLTMVNNFEEVDHDKIKKIINECCSSNKSIRAAERYLWRIPVCYDLAFGIDLEETSNSLGLSVEKLIELHTSFQYVVYGIGFLPGFMYLGSLPQALEIPRHKEPRPEVAKGSVGLAGKQTGIYPQDSPGGWNIIGNCPIPIFDSGKEKPCFANVGDKIQFYEISGGKYDLHKIECEVGIYKPEKIKLDA